jgi:hypothetical protein
VIETYSAKAPLWQSGVIPDSPFFQMRQFSRNLYLDAIGLWSYPALLIQNRRLFWLHVVCRIERDKEKPGYWIYRPQAMALTRPENVVVGRYQDFSLDEDPFADLSWDEQMGRFPHYTVAELSADGLLREELRLLGMYREAGECFMDSESVPPDFQALYVQLSHPVLLNAVCKLDPQFKKAITG